MQILRGYTTAAATMETGAAIKRKTAKFCLVCATVIALPCAVPGQTCAITSPTSGQVFHSPAPLQLTASVVSAATAYKLIWSIDGQRWANGLARRDPGLVDDFRDVWQGPWTVTWYTGLNGDGAHTVSGVLTDVFGNTLATCAPVTFDVRLEGMDNQSINMLPNWPWPNAVGTPSSGNTAATPPINATGATLLIAAISWRNACASPTITDNSGNIWVKAVGGSGGGSNMSGGIWYARSPSLVTTSSMLFTVTCTAGAPMIIGAAVTGTLTSGGADVTGFNGGTAVTSLPVSSSPVTPSNPNEVCFTVMGTGGPFTNEGPYVGMTSGFVQLNLGIPYDTGHGYSGAHLGYQIQTTSTAVNPSWLMGAAAPNAGAAIACFQI